MRLRSRERLGRQTVERTHPGFPSGPLATPPPGAGRQGECEDARRVPEFHAARKRDRRLIDASVLWRRWRAHQSQSAVAMASRATRPSKAVVRCSRRGLRAAVAIGSAGTEPTPLVRLECERCRSRTETAPQGRFSRTDRRRARTRARSAARRRLERRAVLQIALSVSSVVWPDAGRRWRLSRTTLRAKTSARVSMSGPHLLWRYTRLHPSTTPASCVLSRGGLSEPSRRLREAESRILACPPP